MKKYLFDSDYLIDFFKLKESAKGTVESLLHKHPLSISILSITELRSGWSEQEAEKYLPKVYELFSVEYITEDIAELAGKWRQEYKPKGVTIQTVDATIAATAYIRDYCLVTNNLKDYPMPELNLYKNTV